MSLNWTVSKVTDWESVCYMEAPCDIPSQFIKQGDRMLNPVTESLIWATISVDLPGITRENATEFYARLRFMERMDGARLIRAEVDGVRPEGEAAFITLDEILDHIGLTANVIAKSRTAWLNGLKHSFDRDLDSLKAAAERKLSENVTAYKE